MGREAFKGDLAMVKLTGLLLEGQTLTAKSIAQAIGVEPAAGLAKLRALRTLPEVMKVKVGKAEGLRYPTLLPRRSVSAFDVGAACLVSSLASTLRGTNFEEPARRIVEDVVKRSLPHQGTSNLDRKFWFVARGGDRALRDRGMFGAVVAAVLEEQVVRFEYEHFDGRKETLQLEPLTLALHDHQFYLICRRREPPRFYPYRLARMSNVTVHSGFTYPGVAEYDLPTVFRAAFGIFIAKEGPIETVRLRLTGKWVRYVETHRWHESQSHSPGPNGSVDLVLQVRVCPELEGWVRWLGSDAEVLEPVSLRRRIAEELQESAALYRRAGPGLSSKSRRAPRAAAEAAVKKRQSSRAVLRKRPA